MVTISNKNDIHTHTPKSPTTSSSQPPTKIGNIPLSGHGPNNYSNNIDINTASPTGNGYKRSERELINIIRTICKKTNVDINITNLDLLIIISGKTKEGLLLCQPEELNSYIQKLEQKLEGANRAIQEDNVSKQNPSQIASANLIKNYVRLLDGEIPKGWKSVENFRNAQKNNGTESLSQRLMRFYNIKNYEEFKNLSTDDLAMKMKGYFDTYFHSLKGDKKSVDDMQLRDFTKLLFNSSPEEYSKFRDALSYLVVNNRDKGYEAILESFVTDAEKTKFVKTAPEDFMEETLGTVDQRGEISSEDQKARFVAVHLKYADAEYLEEYHEKSKTNALSFYEKNAEKLNNITEEQKANILKKLEILELIEKQEQILAITNKQKQGEALTPEEESLLSNPLTEEEIALIKDFEGLTSEEQEILELIQKDRFYRGDNAGQIIGVGINKVIDDTSKEELLETINYDAYEIGEKAGNDFYKNILETVADYAASMPEEERDAFQKLMESTLGDNYTNVANGNSSEILPPTKGNKAIAENSSSEQTKQTQQQGGIGFNTSNYPQQPEQVASSVLYMTNSILINNKEVETNEFVDEKKENTDNILYSKDLNMTKFLEYIHDKGVFNTVYEIYSNISNVTNQFIINSGKKLYKILPPDLQEKILRNVNSSDGFVDLLKETNDIVVLELKPNFSNSNKNQILEEAQREAKERLKKYEDTKIA